MISGIIKFLKKAIWPVDNRSEYQIKYENGEFPECFRPCPPFYAICNAYAGGDKCNKCFNEHGFIDSIE